MNRKGEFKGLINPSTTIVDNAIHTFFGLIYHDMGMEEAEKGHYNIALRFLCEAEDNITEIRSGGLCVAALYFSFGRVYAMKNKYNKSLKYLKKAKKLLQSEMREINWKIEQVKYLKNENRK